MRADPPPDDAHAATVPAATAATAIAVSRRCPGGRAGPARLLPEAKVKALIIVPTSLGCAPDHIKLA